MLKEFEIMDDLDELEQRIINTAKYHQSHPPKQWSGTSRLFDNWYTLAHHHLLNAILPKIEHQLVNYWPTYILWTPSAARSGSYTYKEGGFGTGYTVLTLKNIVLISLGQITTQFPLYKQGARGFAGRMLSGFFGEMDNRCPVAGDRVHRVHIDSILDVQVIQTRDSETPIALRTIDELFHLYEHFKNQRSEIVAAIRMTKSGILSRALNLQSAVVNPSTTSTGNPVEKLAQLKQMLDAGLINPQEYESKKLDILSRL
jgi:hypothetical protein